MRDAETRAPWLAEPRHGFAVVTGVMALWIAGFALFYPDAITLGDEAGFLRQALAYAQGESEWLSVHPITGQPSVLHPTHRPPGTALLLAPLVRGFGWRGSFVVPALCLLATVAFTTLWIRGAGGSPLYALAIPLFPAGLVLGRLPTSDVPAAALAAAALLAFWRGGVAGSLVAGALAGASPLLRETLPLLFAPLFLGALLRRERRSAALLIGGLLGLGVWLGANQWAHGSPLHVRSGLGYDFSLANLASNAPFYALVVLVVVPGGMIFCLAYRGPRRPELLASVLGFVGLHAAYGYTGIESGPLARLVLGTRFMLPLLPILAFQAAEAAPRLHRALLRALGPRAAPIERSLSALLLAAIAAIGLGCFAVHPLFWRWQRSHAEIARLLYANTEQSAPLLTPVGLMYRYVNGVYGRRAVYNLDSTPPAQVGGIVRRYGTLYLALLDRTDSDHWRSRTAAAEEYLVALQPLSPRLRIDRTLPGGERLRIWRLTRRAAFPTQPPRD